MAVTYRTRIGDAFSEGCRLLWLAVEAEGLTNAAAGRAVACARPDFLKIIYGDRKPNRDESIRIEDRFKVPIRAWDEKKLAAPFLLPAARPKPPESATSLRGAANDSDDLPSKDRTGTGGAQ